MTTVKLQVRIAARTAVGLVRTENQDCILVAGWMNAEDASITLRQTLEHGDRMVIGVFDGMGGHQGGAIASRVAAGVVGHTTLPDAQALRQSIDVAHRAILAAHSVPGLEGMGTTAVIARLELESMTLAHAGDSRAYRSIEGAVGLLTEPHRRLDPLRPSATVLTQCLGGMGQTPTPVVEEFRIARPMRLLLCSDGLADEVPEATIRELLPFGEPDAAAEALVNAAFEAGAADNVSVVVADLVPELM